MASETILIADNNRNDEVLLKQSLGEEGFQVLTARTRNSLCEWATDPKVALIMLDLSLPKESDFDFFRTLRASLPIPIVVMSSRTREWDKIIAFEMGADDYITKPFSMNEVLARVKSHLRRERRRHFHECKRVVFEVGDLKIHKETYEVYVEGQRMKLSAKEFQILAFLAENRNRVLTREQIYDGVWGTGDYGDFHTVTVHLMNIRSKIDPHRRYIKTVRGAGYKFTAHP